MNLWRALRSHWPEYLIEAWALGMFMISAGVFTLLLEYPMSPLHQALEDASLRRALVGAAMGTTAIALIYSRWGKRSGAHMNPAITLSFLRLGKISSADATLYMIAQFVGGALGVFVVAQMFGVAFRDPPVSYVVTAPGVGGYPSAFFAELLISAGMMLTVLVVSNSRRYAWATGLFAGVLVAVYITFAGPYSGMSMNPARSLASAMAAGRWEALWIYFTAPVAGMLLAAELYVRVSAAPRVKCAKLLHPDDVRCIHCGHEPQPATVERPRQPRNSMRNPL